MRYDNALNVLAVWIDRRLRKILANRHFPCGMPKVAQVEENTNLFTPASRIAIKSCTGLAELFS